MKKHSCIGKWQRESKRIIDLYSNVPSLKKVAKEIGCGIGTVSRVLHKNKILTKRVDYTGKWQKYTGRIIGLYNKGLSIIDVSKEIGCWSATVSRILHENGIPVRYPYIVPAKEALEIRKENRYKLGPLGKKRCLRCKEIYSVKFFDIKKKGVLDSKCKNCQKKNRIKYKNKLRNNPEEYCKKLVVHLKHRAKKCGVPFNIDTGYLYNILQNQGLKCFYTGVNLDFTKVIKDRSRPHNLFPSVDRLIPSKGYVKDNLVWSTYYVNRMKSDLSFTDFIKTCKIILKITKSKI
jgi:hypothetical protein